MNSCDAVKLPHEHVAVHRVRRFIQSASKRVHIIILCTYPTAPEFRVSSSNSHSSSESPLACPFSVFCRLFVAGDMVSTKNKRVPFAMMDEWWLDGVSLSLAAVKMMGVGVSWFDGHPARHFHFDGQTPDARP